MADYLPDSWPTVAGLVAALVVIVNIALRIAALGIIPGNRKPSTGMAWLLVILLAPLLGFAAFLLFGSARVGRKRHLKQEEVNAAITARIDDAGLPDEPVPGPAYLTSVAALNRQLGALPVVTGNDVELLADYSLSIAAMTEAVATAQPVCTSSSTSPRGRADRARCSRSWRGPRTAGVEVRLLFDHLGSSGMPGYPDMLEKLRANGVCSGTRCCPSSRCTDEFRRPDLRNHRKLLVVDGSWRSPARRTSPNPATTSRRTTSSAASGSS